MTKRWRGQKKKANREDIVKFVEVASEDAVSQAELASVGELVMESGPGTTFVQSLLETNTATKELNVLLSIFGLAEESPPLDMKRFDEMFSTIAAAQTLTRPLSIESERGKYVELLVTRGLDEEQVSSLPRTIFGLLKAAYPKLER